MWRHVALAVLVALVLFTLNAAVRLHRNITAAKKTGLPYYIIPWHSTGPFTRRGTGFIIRMVEKLMDTSKPGCRWLRLLDFESSLMYLRKNEEAYGDTFLTVSPVKIILKTSNAELVSQITTRRNDFIKLVKNLRIINIFGVSVLTTEGAEWKRHKKITGPSFSEKSNRLVFEESLRQADGMINWWASQDAKTRRDIKVENPLRGTSTLSFHLICGAGFGVPMLWDGETMEKLQGNEVPGFSYMLPGGQHAFSLKESIFGLVSHLIWFAAFSVSSLKRSPLKSMKKVYTYYFECLTYFHELLELKKRQVYMGESDKETMDLMGTMVKSSEEAPPDSKPSDPNSARLSKEEIIGNCFIMMFAGHETTAHSIHFSMIYLAISLHDQRRTQAEVDSIVGTKATSEWSYITDMPRLYNSMVGAVLNEQLRLLPALQTITKSADGDQSVHMDGRDFVIPDKTYIRLNVIGTNRNPRYWPTVKSQASGKENDMDDFIPERWLPKDRSTNGEKTTKNEIVDGLETASFEASSTNSLFKPPKGAFMTFSDGPRACPGRRFAQVEITAVLSAILHKYSIELDVSEYASDQEVARMGREERRRIYERAVDNARRNLLRCRQMITISLEEGDKIPLRFVERGSERFADLF